MSRRFVDVDCWKVRKHGQWAEGDTFLSRRTPDRVMSVLSDGLGSGVKASVLSTLTATLALKSLENRLPPERTAAMIMASLPVCSQRQIAYATFTLLDVEEGCRVRMLEYDNPPALVFRRSEPRTVERAPLPFQDSSQKTKNLGRALFSVEPGDRILFFSDGVTQAGMGSRLHPLGWGASNLQTYVQNLLIQEPGISARQLARRVVKEALKWDQDKAKDDISCAVLSIREPRELLILSGPPYQREKDGELAREFAHWPGKKVICGGTTAQILGRHLNKAVGVNLTGPRDGLPPPGRMEGADLVTEGILTLGRCAELLEGYQTFETVPASPALDLVLHFLDADRITFIVGTRINEAHQDPHMPLELEIRRNIVKKIAGLLEVKFLKQTSIRYF